MASLESVTGGIGSAASAGNGVAGFLDGLFGFSARRQLNNQKKLMNHSQELWKEQQQIMAQQQLEQWNRENEYNDPTNYYKRLLQGADTNGLSKAAILGDAAGGTVGQSGHNANPSSGPGVGPGSASLSPFGSVSALSNLRSRAEINNIEADTKQKLSQAGLNDSQVKVNEANEEVLANSAALIAEQTLTESVRRGLITAQENYQKLVNAKYDKMTDAEIDKLVADTLAIKVHADKEWKEAQWVDKQAEAQIRQMQSMVILNAAIAKAQRALADKYGAEYVGQLNQNDQWNRTIDAIVHEIETRSRFAGVTALAPLAKSIGGVTTSVITRLKEWTSGDYEQGYGIYEAITDELVKSAPVVSYGE